MDGNDELPGSVSTTSSSSRSTISSSPPRQRQNLAAKSISRSIPLRFSQRISKKQGNNVTSPPDTEMLSATRSNLSLTHFSPSIHSTPKKQQRIDVPSRRLHFSPIHFSPPLHSTPKKQRIDVPSRSLKSVDSTMEHSKETEEMGDYEMSVIKHIITIEEVCTRKRLFKNSVSNSENLEDFSQKENSKSSIPVLLNGNIVNSVYMLDQHIRITNTCAFDAVLQSLLIAYRDWSRYKSYVDFSPIKILTFIKLLSAVGATPELYKERTIILSNFFPVSEENRIDCVTNITLLTDKLFQQAMSYRTLQECLLCFKKHRKDVVVLEISLNLLRQYNISCLQLAIDHSIIPKNLKCDYCGNEKIRLSLKTGAHLFLDIELLQWISIDRTNKNPQQPKTITLLDIPLNIIFLNFCYILISAIEYKSNNDEMNISSSAGGHYIAYCRRRTGIWEMYDDLKKCMNACRTVSYEALLQHRTISLLIYIKQEQYEEVNGNN